MNILVGIGPESIPALVNIATDRQAPEREWVLFEIAQFGEAARPAVSPLVECLKDPDPQVVLGAARILASLRVEPTATVPALLSCLQGVDRLGLGEPSKAWYYATHGLAQFGTNAQIAMPVLIDELERRREDDDQVCHLMMTMATVAAEPKVVVQVLMNYLQGTNQLLCFYSASALGKLGPSARAALPSLTNALQYPETQEVVSKAIREIDSDSAGTAGAD